MTDRGVERCDGCGFVYEELAVAAVGDALRVGARSFAERLAAGAEEDERRLRARPQPEVWSALEYACHVRDVLLVQRDRVLRALVEDRPVFAPMHREERVALARYADEDPRSVGAQVTTAAALLATVLGHLDAHQWARPCVYNYPTRCVRDVGWVGRHTVHEMVHHLADVDRGLARLAAGEPGL